MATLRERVLDLVHLASQVNAITYHWHSEIRQVQLIKMHRARYIYNDLHEKFMCILPTKEVKPVLAMVKEIMTELERFLENNWTEDGKGGAYHASGRICDLTRALKDM
jgi:hypothetical protein